MNPSERQATLSLSALFAIRMFGLFILLPILSVLGTDLKGATPALLGFAIGVYGLTQACFQIPFGSLSDRYGRKPLILFGLSLFIIGSLVAAVSESIWGLIVGRLLQGSGAIGGVIVALIADLTRIDVRTKAMASVGASIGVSFLLALLLGPLFGQSLGLDGIFYLVAALGVLGAGVAFYCLPGSARPQQQAIDPADHSHQAFKLINTLQNPQLMRLNISIFLLHMLLTTLFIALPPLLVSTHNLSIETHWKIYLPVMIGSFLMIIPSIIFAEKKGQIKTVLVVMVGLILASSIIFHQSYNNLMLLITGLVLFFSGFNALEAMLPSLLSKIAPAGRRGICMSTYSTFQFLGAFVGGSLGGYLFEYFDFQGVTLFAGIASGLWFIIILSLRAPEHLKSYSITLESVTMEFSQFEQHLLKMPGVREVFMDPNGKVVHFKADHRLFDMAFLNDLKSLQLENV